MTPSEFKAPWMMKPLDEWSIVGMNHHHKDGQRFLFVAMVKGEHCIKEEGMDTVYVWNRLAKAARQAKLDGKA